MRRFTRSLAGKSYVAETGKSTKAGDDPWPNSARTLPIYIIRPMLHLISASTAAATIQAGNAVCAALAFVAVYSYLHWLPQPHAF